MRSLSLLPVFVAFVLSLLCPGPLAAQSPVPTAFSARLDSIGLRLDYPPEGNFRLRPNPANDYLASQLTLFSKEEKLEMRLHAFPEDSTDPYYRRPHVRTGLLQLNLSSNAEDAVTAVHSFDEAELALLNADWARMYTFRPKRSYSERRHAQLIALYRQGRGLSYLVLLFDRPPAAVEERQRTLRFR